MMEHRASKSVKGQSQEEMTMRIEVEAAATSTVHMDSEIGHIHMKEEPCLVQSVKKEPALLVKEEILNNSIQDDNELPCVQGTLTPASTGSVNRARITSLADLFNVKHELEEMDIGPTILQHMDINYTINKNVCAVTEENTIVESCNKAMPGTRIKKESIEDNLKDDNELPCVQGTLTPASTGSVNRARITSLADLFNVKHELEEMDIGPTILQHMDINYTINKNVCAVTEENTIVESCNKAMPGTRIKKESIEDNLKDNKTISCKYCGQTKTKEDYDETHLKSCQAQQTDLLQHLLRQNQAMKSGDFKCDACKRTFHRPQLLSAHRKLHQRNESKTYMTTSSAITRSSIQSQDETVKMKRKPFVCDLYEKGYSSGIKQSVCHICDAKFSAEGHLARHLRIHTGEKPYQCDICDARYTQSGTLSRHKKIHTGEKPYQCDTCNARFTLKGALSRHNKIHTGEKPYQCETCNARFTQKGALSQHKKIHTGEKPYQCDICDARYIQSGTLSRHKKIHTGEKPYQCDICDARFKQNGALSQHKEIHTGEKPYQCDTCNARFTQKCALSQHKKIHTGEKPYQCDICDARFKQNGALSQHKKIHTGEKPYKCDTCNARFKQKGALSKHKKIHTGEKPHQCETCNASFTYKFGLLVHMRVHTGEKPYHCDTCNARFKRKGALSQHKKIHTGEKPYQCDICDARFTHNGTLSQHKKIHTDEKPLPV